MNTYQLNYKFCIKFFTILSFAIILSLKANAQDEEQGKASYYANKFEGKTTASGEKYFHNKLTAAHRTLPFGTIVKIINIENNKEVIVRINDRGPFIDGRIIDVSKSAAEVLGFVEQGIVDVKIMIYNEKEEKNKETSEQLNNEVSEIPEKSNSEQDNEVIIPDEELVTTPEPSNTIVSENQAPVSTPAEITNFSIKSEKVSVRGFGIQIASYKELGNLLEQCAKVEIELKQQVIVQVVTDAETRIYRLIVGIFDTRSKAEYFKDTIKDMYQGFVVVF